MFISGRALVVAVAFLGVAAAVLVERAEESYEQDLTKIPGIPGKDYPNYRRIPKTSFDCGSVPFVPGIYANIESGCQVYHICHDGREGHQGAPFLCGAGTIFNQKEFVCDWWYNFDCNTAQSLWSLNADPEHNPFTANKTAQAVAEVAEASEKFLINV